MMVCSTRRAVLALTTCVVFAAEIPLYAAAAAEEGLTATGHVHPVITFQGSAITERLPVSLSRPRRILLDGHSDLIVADWGAGRVLRVPLHEGETTVIAEDLNEPAGLAQDRLGNLYVALHAGGIDGAGVVLKISTMGEESLFASGLTGPTDLAFDASGQLYVANFDANNIARISPNGMVTAVAQNIPSPAGLAFDPEGNLLVANSNEGTISSIDPMGRVRVIARGLNVPSDIAVDVEGHVIVTNSAGRRLSYLTPQRKLRTFASVPKGTVAVQFDQENNLLLVNWDLRLAMKVTTNLSVPCPHCEKQIPIRLVPRKPAPEHPKSQQLKDDAGPVI